MLRRAAAALVVLIVLAFAGEVLVRNIGLIPIQDRIKLQQESGDYTFIADADLGSRQPPNRDEVWNTRGFSYRIETDSLGFPNRMPWPDRVDGVVLGNSLIIGPGVGIDGQFSTLLERRFPGRRFLNLGLAGASPEHQYRIYRAHAKALEPDLVISCLWVASDIDNTMNFSRWLQQEARASNYFRFRTTTGARQNRPSLLGRARRSLSGSHLLRAAYHAQQSLRDPLTERVRFPSGSRVYLSVRQQLGLAAGVERPGMPALMDDFIRPLERLRAEVDAGGGRFLVVLLPSKEEIYGARTFPEVLRTIEDVRKHLEDADLPVLDLYEFIASRGADTPPFFPADIHFNAYGNELVAEAIGGWGTAEGLFAN